MRPREQDSYGRREERGMDRGAPRRRTRHVEAGQVIDYKDYELLRKFMTERGKITPRRFAGTTAKQQRQITRAIRRARVMGLVP